MTWYEFYNTGDDAADNAMGEAWIAQTFTPSVAHFISYVILKLYKLGWPGILTVSIRATDGSGHPTGNDLCSGTIDTGAFLTTDPGGALYQIALGAGYTLNANTKYAIVIRAPGGDAYNRVYWRCDITSPTYYGGNRENSGDSGASWASSYGADMMFEEWGDPISVPVYSGEITDFYFKKGSTYYRKSLGQIPATVVADGQSFEIGVDFQAAATCPGSFFVSCKVVVTDPQGNVYSPTPDRAGISPGELLTNWGPFQLPQITISGNWTLLIQFILDDGTVVATWGPSTLFTTETVSTITGFKILDYIKV
jgi:hypothetical protein